MGITWYNYQNIGVFCLLLYWHCRWLDPCLSLSNHPGVTSYFRCSCRQKAAAGAVAGAVAPVRSFFREGLLTWRNLWFQHFPAKPRARVVHLSIQSKSDAGYLDTILHHITHWSTPWEKPNHIKPVTVHPIIAPTLVVFDHCFYHTITDMRMYISLCIYIYTHRRWITHEKLLCSRN